MPKLQLSFHGTFALKKEDIIKILQTASEETGLTGGLENLMAKTGLGNRKVPPMRSWASRAGLINGDFLSPEGKIVLKHDPYLESPITEWLMHFYLSFGDKGLQPPPENLADWGGWTWFVYQFLPQNQTFSIDELVGYASTVFTEDTTAKLTKNFRILLRAYTEPKALSRCSYLSVQDNQYTRDRSQLPSITLIGYFLAKLWERDFNEQTSVLHESILNHPMGLARVLGILPDALQNQLNALEAIGIVEQRREVPPFQLLRRWDDPLELLEKSYA